MKILLDIHPSIEEKSGIGRYCDNLTKSLIKRDDLKLSFYSNLPKAKLPSFYKDGTVFSFPVKHGLARTLFGLNYATRKLKPDILHVTTLTPFHKIVPTVLTVHDLCFITKRKAYGLKTVLAFALFFARSLKNADWIIVPSQTVAGKLSELFPETSAKTSVIYEAADTIFSPTEDKAHVKNYLSSNLGINRPYFLVVGNIEKRKSPFEILKSFQKLLTKQKNTCLVFVGTNKLGGIMQAKYENLIKEGYLKILKYTKDQDLNLLYNGAQASVFFSSCEGFGLPILESMKCGTPVVCRDIPVFREVAGDSALFCKNTTELYLAMLRVNKDLSLRKKLANQGFERSRFFSWDKAAKETHKVYKKVLSSST